LRLDLIFHPTKHKARGGEISLSHRKHSRKAPTRDVTVLDGGGYKKQAEQWLRAQIDETLFYVFNMPEFQKWSNGLEL
jgi:hypothetical protein